MPKPTLYRSARRGPDNPLGILSGVGCGWSERRGPHIDVAFSDNDGEAVAGHSIAFDRATALDLAASLIEKAGSLDVIMATEEVGGQRPDPAVASRASLAADMEQRALQDVQAILALRRMKLAGR